MEHLCIFLNMLKTSMAEADRVLCVASQFKMHLQPSRCRREVVSDCKKSSSNPLRFSSNLQETPCLMQSQSSPRLPSGSLMESRRTICIIWCDIFCSALIESKQDYREHEKDACRSPITWENTYNLRSESKNAEEYSTPWNRYMW